MDHTGGKYAVLPADARVKKPGDNIGVFFSPAPIVRIEAVDTIEIGSPDGEIAGARALPGVFSEFAEERRAAESEGPTTG